MRKQKLEKKLPPKFRWFLKGWIINPEYQWLFDSRIKRIIK